MRVSTVRQRCATSAALLSACALLAAAPVQAAAPARDTAVLAQASAAPAGEWWFDLLGVGDAHKTTRGAGAVVALIDSPLHPGAAELQRPNVSVVRSYCGDRVTEQAAANSFHGTSMAGMIAGDGAAVRGAPGLRGVAPDATLRMYVADDTDRPDEFECYDPDTNRSTFAATSRAIRDAVDEGAHIINLSLSMGGLADAVAYAVERGVVVVASANSKGTGIGPETDVGLPAGHPGVVAVSAVDGEGRVWDGSTPGGIYVAAPGIGVRSGQVTQDGGWDPDAVNTGTSPAAAYVSGVLALVKSRYPAATGPQLVQHLLRNTGNEGATQWDRFTGFGVPSLRRLLEEDPTRQPDHVPFLEVPIETMSAAERTASLDRPFAIFGSPTPSPAGSPSPEPAPSAGPSPVSAAPEGEDGGSPVLPIGLGAAALLGLGAGALALRRRTAPTASTTAPPATEGL